MRGHQNSEEVHNLQSPDEKKLLVLLSASVERFGVSRKQDFLSFCHTLTHGCLKVHGVMYFCYPLEPRINRVVIRE